MPHTVFALPGFILPSNLNVLSKYINMKLGFVQAVCPNTEVC